jgi:hypothetical protein
MHWKNIRFFLKRSQVVEGFLLTMTVKKAIGDYYAYHGRFPSNNQTAGVPPPERTDIVVSEIA